jgi:hypothetical protein
MGRHRRRAGVAAMAATALLALPEAEAAAARPVRDSVTGTGTVELVVDGLPEPVVAAFDFDVEARARGRRPRGRVSLEGLFADARVSCLDVRTIGTGTPFTEATMNVVSAQFGLVTLQVSDGNPEGIPDFFGARVPSERARSDCSRLPFGADNVAGFVVTGDVDLVDAG